MQPIRWFTTTNINNNNTTWLKPTHHPPSLLLTLLTMSTARTTGSITNKSPIHLDFTHQDRDLPHLITNSLPTPQHTAWIILQQEE